MSVRHSSDTYILLTPAEARQADSLAIDAGKSSLQLMESAGRAVADILVEYTGTPLELGGEVIVLCGPGNNGGDGFVIARLLDEWGYPVRVLLLGEPSALKGDAKKMAAKWVGEIGTISNCELKGVAVVVDSLFGIGLNKPVNGEVAKLFTKINKADLIRLAVDMPSGLDAETGVALGACFQADTTITFSHKKPGQLVAPGRFLCGGVDHVHVVDIGATENIFEDITPLHFVNEPCLWGKFYPFQGPEAHKYDRGHLLVLGGKEPTLGASRLASIAALRVGAGLVTLAAPTETYPVQASSLTDVMVRRFDSAFGFVGILSDPRISTALLGPGAGVGSKTIELLQQAGVKKCNMVLDADVLTSLVGKTKILQGIADGEVELTPHEGEFAKLFPELDIAADRIGAARTAATQTSSTIVLKGVSTIVAAPDGRVSIASNGPSWLAVGGTGDVLAGLIAGLLAQGMPAFEAASAAVWIHGEAGMKAGRGLIASDLLSIIPAVLP
ncbi:MAG: NAD(P)H-hydrate dehydratase [Kordiimonadaceae bacterium]|nr:NAD(P)H-hydrate dehydratase [Kordiimonadaceae bacterium]